MDQPQGGKDVARRIMKLNYKRGDFYATECSNDTWCVR